MPHLLSPIARPIAGWRPRLHLYFGDHRRYYQCLLRPGPDWGPGPYYIEPDPPPGPSNRLLLCLGHGRSSLPGQSLYRKRQLPRQSDLRRPIFGRVTLSNLISFIMFVGLGLLLIFLSLTGRLSMSGAEEATSRAIQSAAANFTALVGKVPGLDLVFSLLAAFLLYKFIKAATRK